jgi:site-specific DNA recombinase
MASLSPSVPTRVACYARVSTEDQAERQTIAAQIKFLRGYCELHDLPLAGLYVDDGISGTAALEDRPEGRRLLQDAEAGAFDVVLVYRVDRLGRSLKSLMAAHERLESAGVAIRSGTEPFDTSNPMGKFLFTLLGSMAELEKSTITERTSRGRDRVAAQGQYTGGPIPLGYTLDEQRRLIPSERIVEQLGVSEADYVRDLFRRIADGETSLNGECGRLTALGVPRFQRYGGKRGRVIERDGGWGLSSLGAIIHNPTYRGAGVVESRYGDLERPAPALVDVVTWERAQRALVTNRSLSKKNAKNEYLLRGLVKCGWCGLTFVGTTNTGVRKYRCNANAGRANSRPEGRCPASQVHADRLEEIVWQEVRAFVDNPGPYIEQAQRDLRERIATAGQAEEQRKRLVTELAGKEQERERVLGMFRRGRITSEEAERELDAIASEAGQIRDLIDSLRVRVEMAAAQEAYLSDVGAALVKMQDAVQEIEETNDWKRKRELIELLAPRIVLQTEILGVVKVRQRKQASLHLTLAFRSESAVVPIRHSPGARHSRGPGSSSRSGGFTAESA